MGKKHQDLAKSDRKDIQDWLLKEYLSTAERLGRTPSKSQQEEIVKAVYDKVQANGISISIEEVRRYYISKSGRFKKRLERNDFTSK